MRVRLDLKLTASAILCFAFLAGPAAAADVVYSENWYSRSSPLVAYEDDVAQAQAYGTAYQINGYVKNHTYYRDPRSGGDSVYTQTDYAYYVSKATCGAAGSCWDGKKYSDQSARSSSSEWKDQYDADDYTSRTHEGKVRVYYKVCEDQSWSPDACSRNPYVLFSNI